MKTHYRGFDIVLSSADEWSAEISDASTGRRWSHRLTTPINSGREEALKRAQNLVDAFLALHGARTA